MDNFVLLLAPDGDASDELYVYDMGSKEAMTRAFEKVVTDGKEEGNIYLCRVMQSAEVVNPGQLEVFDYGDEE